MGLPFAAKDLIDAAGAPTTWGVAPLVKRHAPDAPVIERLRRAGAVLIGKTATGALAYGDQWWRGQTLNPWCPEEGASGSSAGSAAAVAAGVVPFALGTETLGSLLSPARRCGVATLRPSIGRVPAEGVLTLSPTMDRVGPMARTVAELTPVWAVMAEAEMPAPQARLDGLTLGLDVSAFGASDTARRAAVQTLVGLGATVQPITAPAIPQPLMTAMSAEIATHLDAQLLQHLPQGLRDPALCEGLSDPWWASLDPAPLDETARKAAEMARQHLQNALLMCFDGVDAIVEPAEATPVAHAGCFAGLPALSMPVGAHPRPPMDLEERPQAGGQTRPLPVSLVFTGRQGADALLLSLGQCLETQIQGSHQPPLQWPDSPPQTTPPPG